MASSELPSTMKAWQYSKFGGGADALHLAETVAVPKVKKGQILVKVSATSLNGLDWKLQEGDMRPVLPFHLPYTSGFDLAGEVVAVGPSAGDFKIGDQVFAGQDITVGGAFAEYVVVCASTAALRPSGVSPSQAVALGIQGIAAIQGLRDFAGLPLGDKVDGSKSKKEIKGPVNIMIANATGGVGIVAVQLAKLAGYHVTATCGERNKEFVKGLGADEVLDYKSPEGIALTSPSGVKYNVILDGTAKMTWKTVSPVLANGGKWLHMAPSPGVMAAAAWSQLPFFHHRLVPVLSAATTKDLTTLAKLTAAGSIKLSIDSETPFSKLPEAWAKCKKGHGLGKIVVLMD